jgi:hypothetical protein
VAGGREGGRKEEGRKGRGDEEKYGIFKKGRGKVKEASKKQ